MITLNKLHIIKKTSCYQDVFFINYVTQTYTLKCANALLASAIRCVSSFFLKAAPSPLLAATISLASLSAMLRPFLSRLYRISHFILKEIFLSGRTSEGI